MEIQSKALDALLEKAEQVIRLSIISFKTFCKRMEEENQKIKENYVMPKGNFMSYKIDGIMIRPRCLLILKIVLQIRKC
jgi:hypothetical protein